MNGPPETLGNSSGQIWYLGRPGPCPGLAPGAWCARPGSVPGTAVPTRAHTAPSREMECSFAGAKWAGIGVVTSPSNQTGLDGTLHCHGGWGSDSAP